MPSTTLTDSPTQTVRAFLDAFGARDLDGAVALAAPDVAVTVHPLGVAAVGTDALRAVLAEITGAFPDLIISVSRLVETGDVVTALLTCEGTQSAAFAGVVNQEKHLDLDQAWRFVLGNGQVTAVTAYWCQQQLYRRLAVKRLDHIAIA